MRWLRRLHVHRFTQLVNTIHPGFTYMCRCGKTRRQEKPR